MYMYDIIALWGWLNEWDSFLCMSIHLCSIISWSWSYMSLHLFAEYMSYIQIWRMWLFKFSWRYQSIFMTVSHCHENKMFHDGVTTFSWQCWALTKVIYFVVVHSFSWWVRAPTKLDFVAAIHSHENIYSCVFWTATNYFRVVFLNLTTPHFHGGGSPPRKRYVTVHSHENSIFVVLDSWGLFRDRRLSRNIFVAGFIVFVTVSHSHEISVFW